MSSTTVNPFVSYRDFAREVAEFLRQQQYAAVE